MKTGFKVLWSRLGERLWVRPLAMCILAIAGAFFARGADYTDLGRIVPHITTDSIKTLLTVMSASMLVIATFSVGSMVSAYASVSSTATPRAFSLVIADDTSQNALSAFIGAFIFSLISLIALENSFFDQAGRFALFTLTCLVFAIVIVTFVGWVDSIARLGRLGTTINKVEAATATALKNRKRAPTLGGASVTHGRDNPQRVALHGNSVGYVQRVNVTALQKCAEEMGVRIEVVALPGAFIAPGRPLAYVSAGRATINTEEMASAFSIGDDREFDEDPRFGLIVLSEIASRALSPGINDPGTAIDVIGTLVRLFTLWSEPIGTEDKEPIVNDRIEVPELSLQDMFDDAFNAIARDGAGTIEVVVWLQKAFESLASTSNVAMREVAIRHARQALARAEKALEFPDDLSCARNSARFVETSSV